MLLFLLIGSIGLTAWFNPAVFGEGTLDVTRTTTHLALFTALGVAAIFYQIDNRRHLLWIGPTLLTAGFFVFQLNAVPRRATCVATSIVLIQSARNSLDLPGRRVWFGLP